jgi:tetratricopeptide (TPR) repeat protein
MRYFKCFIVAATLALAWWPISPSMAQSDDANRLTKKVLELWRSGKYAEAIPLAQRALVIWEKQLGPHHRNVATALNNLALLYVGQSRYVDAEPLYKRSLSIREKALGPDVGEGRD